MRSVNKVTLLGNVGQDPTVKALASGTMVATVSLATSYKPKDKEQVTEWHRLIAFGRTAEIVRDYVVKGSALYVEGQIQTRKWEDKASGETKYMVEIVVRELSLLGSKHAERSKGAVNTAAGADPEITDDDIPF